MRRCSASKMALQRPPQSVQRPMASRSSATGPRDASACHRETLIITHTHTHTHTQAHTHIHTHTHTHTHIHTHTHTHTYIHIYIYTYIYIYIYIAQRLGSVRVQLLTLRAAAERVGQPQQARPVSSFAPCLGRASRTRARTHTHAKSRARRAQRTAIAGCTGWATRTAAAVSAAVCALAFASTVGVIAGCVLRADCWCSGWVGRSHEATALLARLGAAVSAAQVAAAGAQAGRR
jgi:hypothetical protein